MEPSQALLNFLASPDMEGTKLAAYQDGDGIWTIGVGHTLNVQPGDTCTLAQALAWLGEDMTVAARAVAARLAGPSQNEFDAFCSLCFNIGVGNFAKVSAVEFFNNGNKEEAARRFLLWNKVAGAPSDGLIKGRSCEAMMMLGQPWRTADFAVESNPALNTATLTRCMEAYR